MSSNIHWVATRWVIVEKTGARIEQAEYFENPYQTPTSVTRQIMASNAPNEAYTDWVRNTFSAKEYELVYAEDDIFEEREPIGTKEISVAEEHCRRFQEWCESMVEDGWEVHPEAL